MRILAAVGALGPPTLAGAITRYQQHRRRRPCTAVDLAVALTMSGVTRDKQGRWRAPPGTPVPDRYRAVLAAGAGRDLTRQDMIDVLTTAGYTHSSATGVLTTTYPLFTRTGPNRYRVLEAVDQE